MSEDIPSLALSFNRKINNWIAKNRKNLIPRPAYIDEIVNDDTFIIRITKLSQALGYTAWGIHYSNRVCEYITAEQDKVLDMILEWIISTGEHSYFFEENINGRRQLCFAVKPDSELTVLLLKI